jgi:microsomal dipeptidase-like Zn-dependent dipeptidase
MIPVADAHCDLLSYLQTAANASPLANESRCSLPLLEQGGVVLQTTAIFTVTRQGSTQVAAGEVEKLIHLLKNYSERVYLLSQLEQLSDVPFAGKIALLPAIENASSFCEEHEPIQKGFERLAKMQQQLGRIFYISLTHHTENRFGGGNQTNTGLKDDGRRLLDYLANQQIAIDFSHTSDALAHDVLSYIDKQQLPLQVMASHSNFRALHSHPRNLPDEIAKEIIRRNGIIGLTWLKAYLGDAPLNLFNHLRYGISLGAENLMVCGADLFYYLPKHFPQGVFFDRYSNASHYQVLIADMEAQNFTEKTKKGFLHRNLLRFLYKLWQKQGEKLQ